MALMYYDQCTSSSTTADIWNNWVTSPTATTVGPTSNSVWYIWTDNNTGLTTSTITTTSSTASNTIWYSWVDATAANVPMPVQREPTAEEQAELVRREAQYERQIAERRQQAKEQQEKRQAALKRSMELLRENLSAKQRAALDKHGWFLVEGGHTKKTYRIHGDRCAGNIVELDGKKEVARYCVHASHEIPLGDQLLAQAISVRWDEPHLIKTANRTALAA